MEREKMSQPQLLRMSGDEYRKIPALNSGGISQLNKSIDSYVAYKNEHREPTAAMKLGSMFHSYMEKTFDDNYIFVDADARTKAGKAEKAAAEESGKTQYGRSERKILEVWKRNIERIEIDNTKVLDLAWGDDAIREGIITWEEDGVPMKIMVDCFLPSRLMFIDYKTTQSAATLSKLASSSVDFGYHIQAEFYKRGVSHYLASINDTTFDEMYERVSYYYLFVEKDSPYGHRVISYSNTDHRIARQIIDNAKRQYKFYAANKEMFDSKQLWGGYSLTPEVVALPAWYRNVFKDVDEDLEPISGDF